MSYLQKLIKKSKAVSEPQEQKGALDWEKGDRETQNWQVAMSETIATEEPRGKHGAQLNCQSIENIQ